MRETKKIRILFWGILALGILLRCIRFGQVPNGINQDEAMAAVDAWALSEYRTDRYGTFLPVHLEAWKYGQMSALLSYCMVPFIKLFGLNTVAARLPMLVVSCAGIALVYLVAKKLFNEKLALAAMILTAVNPWQFMQSRWSLDCNLFPHVFLLGFYFLLLGLEKKPWLYVSMIFFGLTFYCYGVAAYSVTAFLFVFFLWCLWKKRIRIYEAFFCTLTFILVALPEAIVLISNARQWKKTFTTPFFTMQYFPESVRSADILLFNFSFAQLGRNAWIFVSRVFLQLPDTFFNSIPEFGPLYHVSIPFILLGIVIFTKRLFREKDIRRQTTMLALWGFLIAGIWVGLITYEVNLNRVNIIIYPLILFSAYGIGLVVEKWKKILPFVAAAYGFSAAFFFFTYFTDYAEESRVYYNRDFLDAVSEADDMQEYDRLYITGNLGWQFSQSSAEILTHYACKIDALYYQGKSNVSGGRILPDYPERYHYIYPEENGAILKDMVSDGLVVLHREDLQYLDFNYDVVDTVGDYLLLTVTE